MKKNKILRLASVMLMLCLITTCAISGTFAKYTTSGTATDAAKVAKWGVSFTITTDLSNSYETDATLPTGVTIANSVYTSTTENKLVAPGTTGDAYVFTVTGTPEVAYKVTYTLDTSNSKDIFLNKTAGVSSDVYRPVAYTVKLNGTAINATPVYTAADVKTIIEKIDFYYAVDTGKYFYTTDNTAGTPTYVESATAPVLTVVWDWDFSTNTTNDGYDTILGDLANGDTVGSYVASDYCIDLALKITATATQVD